MDHQQSFCSNFVCCDSIEEAIAQLIIIHYCADKMAAAPSNYMQL